MVDDERDGVRLSSLDWPLGDGLGVTKGDLVDHLDAFADRLVPLLAGRPLSVLWVRPGQAPFMQRNAPRGRPRLGAQRRRVVLWRESRGAPGALRRPPHPAVAANQRAVEFHVPFLRAGEAQPTGLVLDLDPPEGAAFDDVVAVAGLGGALADGAGGRREDQRHQGAARRRPGEGPGVEDVAAATRALAARTERLDPDRATTAARTGPAGSSSTPPAAGAARSWPPTARGCGRGCPCPAPVAWGDLGAVQPGAVAVDHRRASSSATPTRGPTCCPHRRCLRARRGRAHDPGRAGRGRCTRASAARRPARSPTASEVPGLSTGCPRSTGDGPRGSPMSAPPAHLSMTTDAQTIAFLDKEDAGCRRP